MNAIQKWITLEGGGEDSEAEYLTTLMLSSNLNVFRSLCTMKQFYNSAVRAQNGAFACSKIDKHKNI